MYVPLWIIGDGTGEGLGMLGLMSLHIVVMSLHVLVMSVQWLVAMVSFLSLPSEHTPESSQVSPATTVLRDEAVISVLCSLLSAKASSRVP